MLKHNFQRAAIERDHPVVEILRDVIKAAAFADLRACSSLAHIIGVKLSETTAETRMVTASVTANSRNRRPTISPMNRQRNQHRDQRNRQRNDGEPDLPRAFQRGIERRVAFLQKAIDVLDHDNGVVHHEAGGDGQRHQREIVEAVAQQDTSRRKCRRSKAAPPRWE